MDLGEMNAEQVADYFATAGLHTTVLHRAASKAQPRRFASEPVAITGFGSLFPLPTDCAERMAKVWSDEECLALNAEADRIAEERADWDELLRDKRDAEIARYGHNSGE
jgi:hypothetical protein